MEERRDKRNIVYFIISYVINNLSESFVRYVCELSGKKHNPLSQHPSGPFMDMLHIYKCSFFIVASAKDRL